MDVNGKTVILTGGASGIGAALARQLAAAGGRVVIADRDLEGAIVLAEQIGAVAMPCDVTREADIQRVVAETEALHGPVDIFISNAGLGRGDPGHAASAPDEDWLLNWNVHVMSHVYAARAVLPGMIERGEGYLVNMASAAGLLCQIGDAAYSATKHAAVSFAESLYIAHRDEGVRVSVICPQYVATPLTGLDTAEAGQRASLLTPDDAAGAIMAGIASEDFLILTHPVVKEYVALRGTDPERWLAGMRVLRAKAQQEFGRVHPLDIYKLV
jgi:NAD(P)-dependent dehydrogenase (short-subunit alcohol dehydrogenase family)